MIAYVFSPSCFSKDGAELFRNGLRMIYINMQVDNDDRELDTSPLQSQPELRLANISSGSSTEQVH